MSYSSQISRPTISCDALGCKASSDDYPNSRVLSKGRHKLVRKMLGDRGWLCALGLDFCPKHHDARYDHKVETILAKEARRSAIRWPA